MTSNVQIPRGLMSFFNDSKDVEIQRFFTGLEARVNGTAVSEGLDPSLLVQSNADSELASVSSLTSWIAGTTNQINSTDDGDGTLTLSIDDDYLINNVFGVTDKIEITDNLDGTIDIGISDDYLFGNVIGVTDEIDITDNLDGTIAVGISSNFEIEDIPTTFTDGSIPFADTGFLIEDNPDFTWDNVLKALNVSGTIKGKNRTKQYFYAGF